MLRVLVALAALGSPAAAETFGVFLGGRQLGTLEVAEGSLRAVLDNTPLAVSDGTFTASVRPARTEDGRVVTQYLEESAFSSGNEATSVLFEEGRVVEVVVRPESEVTDLSDPAAVAAGVIDPVAAFGRLAEAEGCPGAFTMYEGRRVVQVAPTGEAREGDVLTCEARYQVVAGPAHLSPLGIEGFNLVMTYDVVGAQVLREMSVRTGPFELRVAR